MGIKKDDLLFSCEFYHYDVVIMFVMLRKKISEMYLYQIVGGTEHTLHAKLTFPQEVHGMLPKSVAAHLVHATMLFTLYSSLQYFCSVPGNITKESGPVSMTFTIPMYNASRLQVKYLQIAKKSSTYNPYRWVRYVTQANSYVARI